MGRPTAGHAFRQRTAQTTMKHHGQYTCAEYRAEMLLLGLRRQLANPDLSDAQRAELLEKIRDLEAQMGMD